MNRSNNTIPPLYLGGLVFGFLYLMLLQTRWIQDYMVLQNAFKMLGFLFLSLHCINAIALYKGTEQLVVGVVFLCFFYIGYRTHKIPQLLITIELIIGAKKIDIYKILKISLVLGFLVCLISMLFSYLGWVDSIFYEIGTRNDISLINIESRNSWGYVWSTNFASHVFFMQTIYIIIKKGKLFFLEICSFFLITLFVFFQTDARLPVFCSLLLISLALIIKINHHLPKWEMFFSMFAIPTFFVISILLPILYKSDNILWFELNFLMSNRLSFSQNAINEHGITIWGQYFEMHGGYYDYEHNYIDSAFLQALVIYGVIYTMILLVSMFYLAKKIYTRQNILLMSIYSIVTLHAIFAQHFIEIAMNPFLFMITATLGQEQIRKINVLNS